MRKCGVCLFGGWKQQAAAPPASPAPSAACVLVASCARLEGADGVLARMEAAAAEKPVGAASAYCTRCRRITWLCRADVEPGADVEAGADKLSADKLSADKLNAACVDFWRNWRTTESVASSLRLVLERNGTKKRRLCRRSERKPRGALEVDDV
jgi:hypothetical protein